MLLVPARAAILSAVLGGLLLGSGVSPAGRMGMTPAAAEATLEPAASEPAAPPTPEVGPSAPARPASPAALLEPLATSSLVTGAATTRAEPLFLRHLTLLL